MTALCFVLGAVSTGWTGPKAVIDTAQVNFGIIHEGTTIAISHTFRLKNGGDSVLTIIKTRKNCGCTSYSYDSIIQPGKTGNIRASVDLNEIKPGTFSKSIIVVTNENGRSLLKLSLTGELVAYIDVNLPSIVLPTIDKKDTTITAVLSSEKADLQVKDARFDMDDPPVSWQESLPVPFSFTAANKKNKQGRWLYSVRLSYVPVGKEARYGSFVLVTNHPKKPEFKIAGVLDPVK